MTEREISSSAFRPPEIPPPAEAPIFAKEKIVRLGDISLIYAAWGEPITGKELISHYQKTNVLTAEIKEMIDNVGFSGGFYYPWDFEPRSEEFQDRQAQYAAELAERVIESRGWDGIDVLVVASISSRGDIPQQAADILRGKGISVDQALFYGQACNGAVAGVIDLSRTESTYGSQAVVVGTESLSGTILNPKELQLVVTFGNGGGAIAFKPGVDIEHITGKTIVEPDKKGVIKTPRIYNLPQNERLIPPPWYQFVDERGDPVGYEDISDYFVVSPEGVFLALPESNNQQAQMNGRETFKFFAEKRRLPALIADVQKSYNERFKAAYRDLGPAIFHPASHPVIIGTFRNYLKLALARDKGLDPKTVAELARMEKEQRKQELDRLKVDFSEISFPWLMGETGLNNISAGTPLVQTTEMIEKGLLKTDVPTPVVSMGIGSVRQVDIVVFRQS